LEPEDVDDAEMVALRIHRYNQQQKKERKRKQHLAEKARRAEVLAAYRAGNDAAFQELGAAHLADGSLTKEQLEKVSDDFATRFLFGDSESSNSASEDESAIDMEVRERQLRKATSSMKSEVNRDAARHAGQCLSSFFCGGTYVHQQMDVNCWLCSPSMENLCADCDQTVHVLPGVLLENAYSHCFRCKRRRCLSCRDAAAARSIYHAQQKERTKLKPCIRCAKSEKRAPRKARK
jgi:hypothetical protein